MPTIVSQTPFSDTAGYGPVPATITNTTGNTLIAFLATGTNNPQTYLPRLTIGDDAHNWWTWAGSATSIFPGANRRVDIWIASNARRADSTFGTNISVAASGLYNGFAGSIIEVANFPTYAVADFVQTGGGFGASVTLSATATVADYVFGAALISGSGNPSFAVTDPTGWTALTEVGTSSTSNDMSSQVVAPAWNTIAAGAVSATWSWTGNQNDLAVMVGFKQTPTAPSQPNPNWPSLKIEAAFGWQPGNNGGTGPPTWTDITTRALNPQGQAILRSERGRDFELSQPAAGSLDIVFNNQDGALNPVNTGSVFYPNVVPELPVRASATWGGRQYGLGFSYASKFPQDFPQPQWGFVSYAGHDAISVASQGQMPSALGGQILADYPYCYYPLGEYYQSPHGLLFANFSRTNLKPMVGYSPPDAQPLQTGQQLGIAGDSSTGIGVTGVTTPIANPGSGCGAFLRDVSLPNIGTNLPAAIELWALSSYPGGVGTGGSPPPQPLLILTSLFTNYMGGGSTTFPGQRFGIFFQSNHTANTDQVIWELVGPQGIAFGSATLGTLTEGTLYQFLFTITYNGTQYVVTTYVNGVAINTTNVAANSPLEIVGMQVGSASPTNGIGTTQNFTIGQVVVYPWALTANRIKAHYNTGATADSGDTLQLRLGKLAAWSGLALPLLCGQSPPSPLIGNADQIQGGPLADALYNLSVDEGGFFFAPADANGAIWYTTRTSLYNRTPRYVFGDRPDIHVTPPFGITPWSFTNAGTPLANNYFIVTNAQAASINVGDQLGIGGSGAYTVTSIGPPAFGFNNIIFTPPFGSIVSSGTTITQFFGEIPYDASSGFDFSDAYLFNIVTSQRTISAAQQLFISQGQAESAPFNAYGATAITEDQTSITSYMPRGPLLLPIETTSDQDAYDRANWSLTKYKQPQLRANQIKLDPASNPTIWYAALGVEQGDIVTVNRRPLGAVMISLACIVQKVEHNIGPDLWETTLTLAPYFPENAVIQLDNASFDQLQDGVLGW